MMTAAQYGGQQPGRAGGEERAQRPAPAAHADHEAADDEEDLHAQAAVARTTSAAVGNWCAGELPQACGDVAVPAAVVVRGDHQGGDEPQPVQGPQPRRVRLGNDRGGRTHGPQLRTSCTGSVGHPSRTGHVQRRARPPLSRPARPPLIPPPQPARCDSGEPRPAPASATGRRATRRTVALRGMKASCAGRPPAAPAR